MKDFTARVVSGHRVTIPDHVRSTENIEEGDVLKLKVEDVEKESS